MSYYQDMLIFTSVACFCATLYLWHCFLLLRKEDLSLRLKRQNPLQRVYVRAEHFILLSMVFVMGMMINFINYILDVQIEIYIYVWLLWDWGVLLFFVFFGRFLTDCLVRDVKW